MSGQWQKLIPVFLVSGYLDSGKTEFIEHILRVSNFGQDANILLLVCEEGEIEYSDLKIAAGNIHICAIAAKEKLNKNTLIDINSSQRPSAVLCEYNGMWLLDDFYASLPDEWEVSNHIFIADAGTILRCNTNMRQLTYDKIRNCNMAIFNRLSSGRNKADYHKLIRAVTTKAKIVFESNDRTIEYDTTEDELPFDIDASTVVVQDKDYAVWYRDINENPDKYQGKTVAVKGMVYIEQSDAESFMIGRPLMLCCMEDVQLAGLTCRKDKAYEIKNKEWAMILANISVDRSKDTPRPVLSVLDVSEVTAPDPVVATF